MNPITDLIFSITWFALLVWAIRSFVRGWQLISQDSTNPRGVWTTQVKRAIHPEMVGVKPGEELMGVTFDKKNSCDLEEYQELQKRINELKEELGGEEDEDDDGDIVVRV
tara:strand:+ start:1110 stop:1439 length:330 start_codon:yes stop_codon:yes gene_type:complete